MKLQQKRIKVFIAYSHRDVKQLNRLLVHLATLEQQGAINCWSDKKISPGTDWRMEIQQTIEEARITVLLISADFLASSFITENELPPLLAAAEAKGTLILSVILSPCGFEYTDLAQFQAVNDPSKPLAKLNSHQKEEVWVKVAETLRNKIASDEQEKVLLKSDFPATEVASNSQIPALPQWQKVFPDMSSLRKDFPDIDGYRIIEAISPESSLQSSFSLQAIQDEINYVGKRINTYQIEREIGRGGLGRVYLARDMRLKSLVAIKLFYSHLSSAQKEGLLFHRNKLTEMLRHTRHDYILPVIDIDSYKGTHYIVTEYASNGSLRERLRRGYPNPLLIEESIDIICQIGQALSYIHEHSIIHRDLKSSNILFNECNEALLTDFDIAVILEAGDVKTTSIMGSPPYMAPEQFEGIVSKQSDQYALGCIAYELCTGRLPFASPHFIAMQFKHTKEKPIAPRQFNQELPIHVERAILKAMAKDPADRHMSVSEFVSALNAG